MCGIFGMIRSQTATNPTQATAVFAELGRLAVERGSDSAGFAVTSATAGAVCVRATRSAVAERVTTLGQVTIVKDTVPFHTLWDDTVHTDLVNASRVAIGHTRWATQGDKSARVNASPLAVGSIIGTHNGDIETRSVPQHTGLPGRFGATDTEWLFQALHRDRKDRRKVVKNLRGVEGRAALAWIDQDRPERVYLARAALSPLSVAFDRDGNLYWASNPGWFRTIDAAFNDEVGFHSITMVREGTLLTVDVAGDEPVLADLREFTPQCRPSDMRLADFAVWRGFHPADEADDRAQSNRSVAPSRVAATPKKSSGAGWKGRSAPLFSEPATTGGRSLMDVRDAATVPDWWADAVSDDDVDPFHDIDAQIEADNSVLVWAEEGHDREVVTALREQATTAEAEAIMAEWDLSTLDAFALFKEEVLSWADDLDDDAWARTASSEATLTQQDVMPAV
jgi:hypothetical protein